MIKNRQELIEFEKRLLKEKKRLLKQLKFSDSILKDTEQNAAQGASVYRTHIADIGSETYQKEISSQLSAYEYEILRQIDEALQRIRDKCYGDCIKCHKPISKARLRALPYTQLCLKCVKGASVKK